MPYYLDNAFLLDNPWITVVGCGGTGGFVAEGLCRLFQGRQATIVLVDHDRVEPHNLLRQNFYVEDVGQIQEPGPRRPAGHGPTGVPSATRSTPSGRRTPSSDGGRYPGLPSYGNSLLIGCADNAAARQGDGRVPAGRPAPVAHRRGQRHQLGPSPHRQRGRPGLRGRTSLRQARPATCSPRPRCSAPTC